MTAPTFVGAASADGGSTGGNTYTNTFTSISPADGDYLVWAIMIEVTGASLTTPPSGWTQRYSSTSVGSRSVLIYDKVWHTGDATSLSYVKSTANADGNTVAAYRGVTSLSYGTGQRRADQSPTNSFTNTAPSITTTVADTWAVGISLEATSTAETSTFASGPTMPSGWTQDYYKAQGTTIQTLTFMHKAMPTPGATGDAIVTYQNTQASNGYAVQIGLVPPATGVSADTTLAATGAVTATAVSNQPAGSSLSATISPTAAATFATTGSAALSAAASVTAAATVSIGATANTALNITAGVTAAATVNRVAGTSLALTVAPSAGAARGASAATSLSASVTTQSQVQTPLEQWMSVLPLYIAHRGGSADWDQLTMYAYDRAVAWSSTIALEVPVWKSLDGVWVVNHDNDPNATGAWSNPGVGNITTRNWTGDLENLISIGHSSPMIRLIDVLNKYGNSRIIWIENKGSLDATGFFNLLDSYAGNTRYVIKQYYDNAPIASAAHARGYKTWGYYYDADAANLPTTQANWDILGMQYNASSGAWTAVTSYGKTVVAHIVATSTQKATATANGATGYMASGVMEVAPQTGSDSVLGVGATTTSAASLNARVQVAQSLVASVAAAAARGTRGGMALSIGATLSADAIVGTVIPVGRRWSTGAGRNQVVGTAGADPWTGSSK